VRNELFQLLNPRYLARLPTVITTPNTVNQLLADTGWERLARLLVGDPNFCSVVDIGEFSAEAQALPASRTRASGRGRGRSR
jgi:hypothetical protein